jgi:hypothetical protein
LLQISTFDAERLERASFIVMKRPPSVDPAIIQTSCSIPGFVGAILSDSRRSETLGEAD